MFARILGEAIEEREKYAESGENKCAKEYMTVALSYIDEHLQEEELSIVQVATQIYLNPVYFGKLQKTVSIQYIFLAIKEVFQ